MSQVVVKFFAAAKDAAGTDELTLDVPPEATIGQLREILISQYPDLDRVLKHASFALNTEYASLETSIPDGSEVACIPPVSGG